MKFKNVALGLLSYVPGAYKALAKGTRGTDTARYCYSVWLRHLVMARRSGLRQMPESAAELGPGDSLGIGLAALISGVKSYFALDVVRYANPKRNLEIFEELDKDSVCVDVLVNNAGFGGFGRFAETGLDHEIQMIQVNVTALTHLTKLFLPEMIKRGRGKVLNVASVAGFLPGPLHAVYHATKSYVLSFSEAVGSEVKGTGVTVTALCPGPTATNFFVRAGAKRMNRYRGLIVMDVTDVCEAGYRGMMAGKSVVIPGLWNKLLTFFVRFIPRRAATRIVHAMQSSGRDES